MKKILLMLLMIFLAFSLIIGACNTGTTEPSPTTTEPSPTTTEPSPTTTEPSPTEGKVYKILWGTIHPGPHDSICLNVYDPWCARIEEETGGRFTFDFVHNSGVAAAPALYDACVAGACDMVSWIPGMIPGRFPLHDIVQLPRFFDFPGSRAGGLTLLALHEKYPEFDAETKEVYFIGGGCPGMAQIFSKDEPIQTLEDMEGKVMSVIGLYRSLSIEALGGTPEAMPTGEIFDAFNKGVLDAVTYCYHGASVSGYLDIADYCVESNLGLGLFCQAMNLDVWNSLPSDLKAYWSAEENWKFVELMGWELDSKQEPDKAHYNEILAGKGLEPAYVLPEAEAARWAEALQPVTDNWLNEVAELGYPAEAMLADAREFGEQYSWYNLDHEWQEEYLRELGAPDYQ